MQKASMHILSMPMTHHCAYLAYEKTTHADTKYICGDEGGCMILVQLISSQLVSSQLVSSQLISSQLVSATTVIGTTAIAIQLILAYNCYWTQLLSAQLLSPHN